MLVHQLDFYFWRKISSSHLSVSRSKFIKKFPVGVSFTKHLCVLPRSDMEADLLFFPNQNPLFHFFLSSVRTKQNSFKTWLMLYKLILHPYPLPLFMVIYNSVMIRYNGIAESLFCQGAELMIAVVIASQ